MSTGTWPLSAAATQILMDLRDDGAPQTTAQTISRLTIKELVMRGDIQVLSMKKRRLRKPEVRVQTNPNGATPPVPAPLDLMVRCLPASSGDDLAKLIKQARKGHTTLFSKDLQDAAIADLKRRGLAEDRYKKVLGFWPSSFVGPTASGREWAARARQDTAGVVTLPAIAEQDPRSALQMAAALGALLLLAPGGLAIAIGLSQKWREGLGTGIEGALAVDADSWLEGLGDTLGNLTDLIASGAFDGTFDAIADAVDSGIDSGVSDGGGDGGSSDGGSGCGGGGCGGGS